MLPAARAVPFTVVRGPFTRGSGGRRRALTMGRCSPMLVGERQDGLPPPAPTSQQGGNAVHRFHVLIRPVAAGSLAAAVLLLSGAGTAKAAPAGPHARGDGRTAAARGMADGAGGPSGRFSAGAPDRANRGAALPRSRPCRTSTAGTPTKTPERGDLAARVPTGARGRRPHTSPSTHRGVGPGNGPHGVRTRSEAARTHLGGWVRAATPKTGTGPVHRPTGPGPFSRSSGRTCPRVTGQDPSSRHRVGPFLTSLVRVRPHAHRAGPVLVSPGRICPRATGSDPSSRHPAGPVLTP